MQPSPKDYQDFAFGLLPANADGQAFATPEHGKWPLGRNVICCDKLNLNILNSAA
jgi:hypothetical protein